MDDTVSLDTDALEQIRREFARDLSAARSPQDVQAVRDRYLGRKQGRLSALWTELGKLPPDRRRELGRHANALKQHIEQELTARREAAPAGEPRADTVDVTLPGRAVTRGRAHPLQHLRERIEEIFGRMGFEILDGPETEDDYHNFEALNMPPEHPARDMQDTLYLETPLVRDVWPVGVGTARVPGADERPATLLRTHTSSMQIRYMAAHAPPVRIISPGRVYRRDNLDVTHTPSFLQVEGLAVGESVTMGDLKGTLTAFLRELFGEETKVMFRPSFFPYTEPSAEVFIGCVFCHGDGCPVCKRTGWLEILGSGMVHPAVFEAVGYDPERYTGWAFGMGIDRVAILKYRVNDIRTFYENDLRFLEQFPA